MPRVYWDSCVVIYRLQAVPPWDRRVAAAMEPIEELRLVVTDLTRLECRTQPLREKDQPMLALFDQFFQRPDIESVSLSKVVFDLATELRAQHLLKTPDALHLAAAITARCDELWTNDRRLEKAAAGRLAIREFSGKTMPNEGTNSV
jgi:predicted nucleic acid-binding protein